MYLLIITYLTHPPNHFYFCHKIRKNVYFINFFDKNKNDLVGGYKLVIVIILNDLLKETIKMVPNIRIKTEEELIKEKIDYIKNNLRFHQDLSIPVEELYNLMTKNNDQDFITVQDKIEYIKKNLIYKEYLSLSIVKLWKGSLHTIKITDRNGFVIKEGNTVSVINENITFKIDEIEKILILHPAVFYAYSDLIEDDEFNTEFLEISEEEKGEKATYYNGNWY